MSSATDHASRPGQPARPAQHGNARRPSAPVVLALLLAAIAGAVLPVFAALAFLISLAARRPLIATAARRWPWLAGGHDASPRACTVLTAAWGVALLAAGAVQAAGAVSGGLSITNPSRFAARALIALAVEVVLAVITLAWLRRGRPAPAPRAGPPPTSSPQ
jgi:hypothetical protein